MTLQQEAVQSSCRGGGGWSRHALAPPWPTTAHLGTPHQGLPLLGVAYGLGSRLRPRISVGGAGPGRRGPGPWPPRPASGPRSERSLPSPHESGGDQNCTTVAPSVMTGGSAEPVRFSLTNSAARLDDSSVPVLSWQTVTVKPPSSVRTAK